MLAVLAYGPDAMPSVHMTMGHTWYLRTKRVKVRWPDSLAKMTNSKFGGRLLKITTIEEDSRTPLTSACTGMGTCMQIHIHHG